MARNKRGGTKKGGRQTKGGGPLSSSTSKKRPALVVKKANLKKRKKDSGRRASPGDRKVGAGQIGIASDWKGPAPLTEALVERILAEYEEYRQENHKRPNSRWTQRDIDGIGKFVFVRNFSPMNMFVTSHLQIH